MTGQFALTDRQQQILWATVRHYIATAEPVGSKSLVDDYNLSVSSATIRSGMGLLEKAGMLYQPHTSAGRVPSDFGYRVYVDYLMTPSDTLADQAQRLFTERLNWETWSLEAVLRGGRPDSLNPQRLHHPYLPPTTAHRQFAAFATVASRPRSGDADCGHRCLSNPIHVDECPQSRR